MIFLISEKTIKECSVLGDNVETQYITSAIQLAQDIRLQSILGERLYDKLQDLVSSGSISSSQYADYKAILDGDIKQFLIFQTLSEIQPILYAKFRNSGMLNGVGENTQQIGLNEVQYLTDYYRDKADFYADHLKRYLCYYGSAKFPEYSHSNSEGKIGASYDEYSSNLNI